MPQLSRPGCAHFNISGCPIQPNNAHSAAGEAAATRIDSPALSLAIVNGPRDGGDARAGFEPAIDILRQGVSNIGGLSGCMTEMTFLQKATPSSGF